MKATIEPIIQVDTREPEGAGWEPYLETPFVRVCLATGDISLLGCSECFCIERKDKDDLISCLSHSRDRFIDELRRGQRVPEFYVIVECSYADILREDYHSRMSANAVWGSVIALQHRFRIPFLFAGTQEIAAHLAETILLRWWTDHTKCLETARKAVRKYHAEARRPSPQKAQIFS
jgi:ERCC4-type nuclease